MVELKEPESCRGVRALFRNSPPMFRPRGGLMRAAGRLDVERGRGPLAWLIATAGGFPRAGSGVPVTLDVEMTKDGFLWKRTFAGKPLASALRERRGDLVEEFGPVKLAFRLFDVGPVTEWRMTGMRLGFLPVPRFLALRISVVTRLSGNGWFVDVRIAAPLVGPVCRWHGFMEFL